jgi:hypothetical protein
MKHVEFLYDCVEDWIELHIREPHRNACARPDAMHKVKITNTHVHIPLLGMDLVTRKEHASFKKYFKGPNNELRELDNETFVILLDRSLQC